MLSLKKFLDETAESFGTEKSKDFDGIIIILIEQILEEDSSEIIEEILKFCSASVLEMSYSSMGSLKKLFENYQKFKFFYNFHILVNALTSKIIKRSGKEFESNWIDSLLDALISGLSAIESETISLSGSALINLLKWEKKNPESLISKKLADHVDFVAVITADMCAMFSRIEEVQFAPFIRIVRFCELIIDVSDPNSGLKERIIETIQKEFINKIYKKTLRTLNSNEIIDGFPLTWCKELLKVCHRGNELVGPLVNEVFTQITTKENLWENADFIEILENERSRTIEPIVKLLFTAEKPNNQTLIIDNVDKVIVIDDLLYRTTLKRQLESFEQFKIDKNIQINGILKENLFIEHRAVFKNWLPYCLMTAKRIQIHEKDLEMQMFIDISRKLIKYLDL